MGRGRAKAKQTKVARDLKYRPVNTDLASLERELRGEPAEVEDMYSEIPEQYADLAAQYDENGTHANRGAEDEEDRP